VAPREVTSGGSSLPSYSLPVEALEYGASLGNAHTWLTTRGGGSIQEIYNIDTGRAVVGTVAVRYTVATHLLVPPGTAGEHSGAAVALRPAEPGTIEIHPAYQRRRFSLPGSLDIAETVFVPLTGDDDPTVAYFQVEIANAGGTAAELAVYGHARLGGTAGADVAARWDGEARALVAADRAAAQCVRLFGCTVAPAGYETSHDFGAAYDPLHVHPLGGETAATGDVLGTLQVAVPLAPGERRTLCFVLAFSHQGEAMARAIYERAGDVEQALADTIARLVRLTGTAQVLCPNPTINLGALWSKVNMARVMARYPTGPAFTNDPNNGDAVVARDACWFVYGNDHLLPEFSRSLLEAFAQRQRPSGKIVEFYRGVDGTDDDYGLNINDDTPLFILAANHHSRATGDLDWLRRIYPAVARTARYIMSQRDERGLVFCTTHDPRGNVWAIAGWRNVIPNYTLNGAVTEINAECVAALRAAGHMAENLGDQPEEADAFFAASDGMRRAMDAHLINPANGLYYLNIDADGIVHSDVTGDEVFPVIFRACSEETGFLIIRRLYYPDFWTTAGLRTCSADDPLYDPSRNYGLQGGVWPGLSWWYAFAAARYHPEIMVRALTASFEHYAADPRTNNTVPGQFSEWFDGASLANRGMRLSPWEPPRFLWAAVEGVCGVVLQPGPAKIAPLVPAAWRWVGLRSLPYHGGSLSYVATREAPGREGSAFRIYATAPVLTEGEIEVFAEDVSDLVSVDSPEVCHLALRRPGRTILFLGHSGPTTSIVGLRLGALLEAERTYAVRLYDSEAYTWHPPTPTPTRGTDLAACTLTIDSQGFRILSFEHVG